MISAIKSVMQSTDIIRFSAIARSVMISAFLNLRFLAVSACFSAIARSVMISAWLLMALFQIAFSFSAIARSVMISASATLPS